MGKPTASRGDSPKHKPPWRSADHTLERASTGQRSHAKESRTQIKEQYTLEYPASEPVPWIGISRLTASSAKQQLGAQLLIKLLVQGYMYQVTGIKKMERSRSICLYICRIFLDMIASGEEKGVSVSCRDADEAVSFLGDLDDAGICWNSGSDPLSYYYRGGCSKSRFPHIFDIHTAPFDDNAFSISWGYEPSHKLVELSALLHERDWSVSPLEYLLGR